MQAQLLYDVDCFEKRRIVDDLYSYDSVWYTTKGISFNSARYDSIYSSKCLLIPMHALFA